MKLLRPKKKVEGALSKEHLQLMKGQQKALQSFVDKECYCSPMFYKIYADEELGRYFLTDGKMMLFSKEMFDVPLLVEHEIPDIFRVNDAYDKFRKDLFCDEYKESVRLHTRDLTGIKAEALLLNRKCPDVLVKMSRVRLLMRICGGDMFFEWKYVQDYPLRFQSNKSDIQGFLAPMCFRVAQNHGTTMYDCPVMKG